MESLRTGRLTLRDLTAHDFATVHAYASDPAVTRYMNWGPNTEQDTRGFIARALNQQAQTPRTHYTLGVCLEDGSLIGGCGLHVTDESSKEGFIGYVLNKTYWGKGHATEIARALLQFGFGTMGLRRIWTTCDTYNVASRRVLEKAGMRREGLLEKDNCKDGAWRDSYLYAALAGDIVEEPSVRP